MFILRIVRFIDDDVFKLTAGQFLVQPGCGEIHVTGDDVSGFDEYFGKDVLCATPWWWAPGIYSHIHPAPLFRGDRSSGCLHRLLVAQHHAGPLTIAHGRGSAVGKPGRCTHPPISAEGIEARLLQGFCGAAGGHLQQLHHFDFIGFVRPKACLITCFMLLFFMG